VLDELGEHVRGVVAGRPALRRGAPRAGVVGGHGVAPEGGDHFAAAAFQSLTLGVMPTTAYLPFLTWVRMMFE